MCSVSNLFLAPALVMMSDKTGTLCHSRPRHSFSPTNLGGSPSREKGAAASTGEGARDVSGGRKINDGRQPPVADRFSLTEYCPPPSITWSHVNLRTHVHAILQ